MEESLVWYVAYGSNLSERRFGEYLDAGPVTTRPRDVRPTVLPHRLVFARWSVRWNGAPAFVDPVVDREAGTLGRAWLVERVQFESVLARENGRDRVVVDPGVYDLDESEGVEVVNGWYGLVLGCPSPDGRPAVTFTSATTRTDLGVPGPAYVDTIVEGLVAGHGLADAEARAYVEARVTPLR